MILIREKLQITKKESFSLMTGYSRMRKSGDSWKWKAVVRGEKLRENRKKIKRIEIRYEKKYFELTKKIIGFQEENRILHSMVSQLRTENTLSRNEFMRIRIICLILFVIGIVSFRAVPGILSVFNEPGIIHISRIPHFTSVINRTVRAGIGLSENVKDASCPWLAVIDTSVDTGTRKALVVLRISPDVFHRRQEAPGLEDCECIGISISKQWNGETVKTALSEIFADMTKPTGIIRDNGTDIKKGIRLLPGNADEKKPETIEDIGHAAGNALKDEFEKKSGFIKFPEIIRKGASRIRQTDRAVFRPPKIRTKGRFQGTGRVAGRAVRILNIIGGRGKTENQSQKGKLRSAFQGLCGLRPFLEKFILTCNIVDDLLKILKTEGLNSDTYNKGKSMPEKLPVRSRVRIRLSYWSDAHISVCKRLSMDGVGMPVSSDVIESLFGKFKNVIQRCPRAELNRPVYVIPLICGRHQPAKIEKMLNEVSHIKMQKILDENMPVTLRQIRRRTLNGKQGVPKNGNACLTNVV